MAAKIKCVLVEDEPLQLKLLRLYCEEHLAEYCTVVKTFTGSEKFIDEEKKLSYDLLLVDIDMDGAKGTDIARLVSKPVVFVTGRDGYEREVLDLQFSQDNIVTLIRKPVDKEKVEKAFKKYLQSKPKALSGVFNTNSGDRNIKFEDILLITTKVDGFKKGILAKYKIEEKFHSRNKILVTNKELITVNLTDFEALQKILPSEEFFQISKSTIVARGAVVNYNADGLTYVNTLSPFISSSYFNVSAETLGEFRRWYKG